MVVNRATVYGSTAVAAGSLEGESWAFWIVWAAIGLGYELFAVFTEKRTGALPLTRVLRDRIMRRSFVAKLGVLTFLTWMWVHFIVPSAGW
jgi:hypothetical protein